MKPIGWISIILDDYSTCHLVAWHVEVWDGSGKIEHNRGGHFCKDPCWLPQQEQVVWQSHERNEENAIRLRVLLQQTAQNRAKKASKY